MSEFLSDKPLSEILRPDVTPEMGFQSYEMLEDDNTVRAAEKTAFLNGEVWNPTLKYPSINETKLQQGIRNLNQILVRSSELNDEEAAGAVWDSASYRMAEMYWLLSAKRLNSDEYAVDSDEFSRRAAEYQELNEQLYGKPEGEIVANIYGEILAQAKEKTLHPSIQSILDEITNGTKLNINDSLLHLDGIEGKQHGRLPKMDGRLDVLREVLYEEFADTFKLVDQYWDEVIMPRCERTGEEPEFTSEDMLDLFTQLRDIRDPDNTANIAIVPNPKAKVIAWDTPTMSVRIGMNRAIPVRSKLAMVGKMIHEFEDHGGRAINGLKTKLPVLGTGLYTEALPGERSDYLTFEEGLGSLCETALDEEAGKWTALYVSRYLAVALAYEGKDFRESFEFLWRACVMMSAKDNEPLSEKLLKAERDRAYAAVLRVRRGTPTEPKFELPLTYNKDLSYLLGKIDVMRYLDMVGDDKQAIRKLFKSKFDPLNSTQNRLVNKYQTDV